MSQPSIPDIGIIQQQLDNYLPHLNPEDGEFTFYELCGFFTAVCSSPEMIPPRDWLPVVLGEGLEIPEQLGEPNDVLGAIMDLYNWINFRVITGETPIPDMMTIDPDEVFSNFGDQAPVGQWSKGFYEAHDWLHEIWEACLNEDLEDELASYMLPLSFFLDENYARAIYEDFARQDKSFTEVAEQMLLLFRHAALDYATLGRTISETLSDLAEEAEAAEEDDDLPDAMFDDLEPVETFRNEAPKVGRNDPCPCGSGKKYKKCCLH